MRTAQRPGAGRAVTVQALGGTGALKIGADFLRRFAPGAQVWISEPSWENHRALFEGAGFKVNIYPYYDAATHGLDFRGMIAALERAARGLDHRAARVLPQSHRRRSSTEQWSRILEVVRARGQVPFLDLAYQGFGDGVEADGAIVRRFAATPGPLFVASSFSKSFSLYGERVGALSIVADRSRRSRAGVVAGQARRAWQLFEPADVRRPDRRDGARLARAVDAVGRRSSARCASASAPIGARWSSDWPHHAPGDDFRFVLEQRGMFSYSGLSRGAGRPAAQRIRRLRDRYRADLRRGAELERNIDYVASCDCCGHRLTAREAFDSSVAGVL